MSEFDDKALFDGALLGETAPETAAEQPQEGGNEPTRDERGRFAASQSEEPERSAEQPEAQAEPEQQQDDPGDRPVPAKRFGEVTRARDEANRRAEEAERRNQEYERQLQFLRSQPPQAQQPQQEQPKPAIWDDPDAWANGLVAPVQTEVQQMREFFSQRLAISQHGQEKVSEAYAALDAAIRRGEVNGQAVQAELRQSMDPFGDIMNWHQRQSVMTQVGSDPQAWFDKQLEAKLSDPAFSKALVEKLSGQARQQPQNGGRPAISMPPSLNRIPAAGSAADDPGDMSDGAIFANALR